MKRHYTVTYISHDRINMFQRFYNTENDDSSDYVWVTMNIVETIQNNTRIAYAKIECQESKYTIPNMSRTMAAQIWWSNNSQPTYYTELKG